MDSAPLEVRDHTLREVVQSLAGIRRPPCSPGERQAARWLAERLRRAGCANVTLEEEPARDGYLQTAAVLGLIAATGTVLALRGRGGAGTLIAGAAAAGLIDDVQNGPRLARRLLRVKRATTNVTAICGDSHALDTLVVMAHHDAHQSGRFYDQRPQLALYRLAPGLIDRARTSPPQWWFGLLGPLLTAVGTASRRHGLLQIALAVTVLGVATVTEIAMNPTVPGANDNLSGVAGLVALAELAGAEPLAGLRVLLVSCGAEEALQEGARGFVGRHRRELDPANTWVVNLETVGSPRLIMLEGEGPIWMEDYTEPGFRDLIDAVAKSSGIELERGFRARASTDSVIHSRAGYPTATLTSLTGFGTLANYHLQSDTPENVDYGTVATAVRLTYLLARALAAKRGAPASAVAPAI